MANQYPSTSTTVSVDNVGLKTTSTTTYNYANPWVAKTASYQVLASESGTVFTNRGAAGSVTFTLPTMAAGLQFKFACPAAHDLVITGPTTSIVGAAGADSGTPAAISATSLTIAGATATSLNSVVTLESDGTNWFVMNIQGQVTAA